MKLTRRQLAAVVSGAAAAHARPEPQAAIPADELATARERLKANSELLAQQRVSMDTEPAFQFKV
jgi:hypothetical protein